MQLREARLRRADDAPGDAVARLREARQRALEALRRRQQVRLGHDDVVEEQRRGDRGAQRELALDLGRRESLHALLDDEAADAVVRHRPADAQVGDGAVGDPHLRAVDDPVAAFLLGAGLHVRGIGAAVRLGEAEAADLAGRVAMSGSHAASALRCRTRRSGYMHSELCTETKLRMPESPRSSSWQMSP